MDRQLHCRQYAFHTVSPFGNSFCLFEIFTDNSCCVVVEILNSCMNSMIFFTCLAWWIKGQLDLSDYWEMWLTLFRPVPQIATAGHVEHDQMIKRVV